MHQKSDRSVWFRQFHKGNDQLPTLFCFPHAGGAANFFFQLSDSLRTVRVLGVQYPGRQDRFNETPLTDIPSLARLIVPHVRAETAGRPYAFFGHSMGAALAFETALQLEHDGDGPALLFVSGRRAPSVPITDGVHLYDDDRLIEAVQRFDAESAERLAHPGLRRMVLPSLRADYIANATYDPGSDRRVTCPVVALVGDSDPVTEVADARAWERHTTGPFELRLFAGGHFYLTDEEQGVAAVMQERLAAAFQTAAESAAR